MATTSLRDSPGIGQDLAEALPNNSEGRDPDLLAGFLDAHPQITPLLHEAAVAVRDHFGDDARIAIEVYHDPEAATHAELYALIQTPLALSSDEALRRLDAFDEGWWLDAMPRAGGLLTIGVERF